MPAPHARRARVRSDVVLGLGPLLMAAGVALWLWPTQPLGDAHAAQSEGDRDVRRALTALNARSKELAELDRTRAIVATDAETAADLSDEEVGIRVQPGERVALSQRIGQRPAALLVSLPRGARAFLPLEPEGLQLTAADGSPRLCRISAVAPAQARPGLSAAVSVCAPLHLPALRAYLQMHAASGTLITGSERIPLVARTDQSTAQSATDSSPERAAAPSGAPRGGPTSRASASDEHSASGSLTSAQRVSIGSPELQLSLELQLRQPPRPLVFTLTIWLLTLSGAALSAWPWLARRRARPSRPSAQPAKATRVLPDGPRASHASVAPPLPSRLGRYELQRRIGAGGMGEVHLARMHGEAGFERTVALKVVASLHQEQDVLLAHFLDEARLAARIHHPNVVDVLALEKLDERYVIAMEYIDGADLASLLNMARQAAEPVPLPVALRILLSVCAGVHAAHSACAADGSNLELIHRDIKSANILISRAGVVKVADFGVARAAQQHMLRATHNDTVKGTIGYMPPEQQLRGALDARSDQYAIGAVAYELLSGRPVDLDVRRLLPLGTSHWPHLPALESLRADLPQGLADVVMRALAYDKQERFPDCAALQEALEGMCEHVAGVTDRAVALWVQELLAAGRSTRVSG